MVPMREFEIMEAFHESQLTRRDFAARYGIGLSTGLRAP